MKILILIASAALAACNTIGATPSIPPASEVTAPARAMNIDEKGIKLAFDTFDTVLTAVDGLIAAKVIEPGSPRALQLRALLYRVQQALNAAASKYRIAGLRCRPIWKPNCRKLWAACRSTMSSAAK